MAVGDPHAPGATRLALDETEGLIPSHVATREQLDEWEAVNILAAERWLAGGRKRNVLDDRFLRRLHTQMFGRTWRWAGRYRSTEKNIGVAPERIAVELRNLVEDTRAQLAHPDAPLDAIAARFHHRLVSIHPFPNGNGRHARQATDLLLEANGAQPFSWGRGNLMHEGTARERYIDALRAADARDEAPLLAFMRS